jgi:hypothetical protein
MDTTTTGTTETTPATPPPAPTPPPPPPPQQTTKTEDDGTADRPEGFALALGLGYGMPMSLENPNLASLRIRFASGIQLEPRVTISNDSKNNDTSTMENETKETIFGLAAIVRIPLLTRNRVDLEGLATAGFTNDKVNPPMDFNTRTDTSFSLGYGLAIGYWITRHWDFTLNVTNPLVTYTSSKVQTGPSMSTKNSDTNLGLVFIPDVFMMIHLYN